VNSPPHEAARPRASLTVLLIALSAFGPMSMDIYLPALPQMTRIFATDVSGAQLTLSSFTATFALAQLFYGPLSDRFGRRPLLLAGLGIYLAGTLACVVTGSLDTLIGARILQAVGACAGAVLSRAVVRDLYDRQRAAHMLSFLAAAMAVAPVIAPMLGGWLVQFSWRWDFAVMLVFGLGTLAGSWALMGETNPHLDRHALGVGRMLSSFAVLVRDPVYVCNSLAVTFVFIGLYSYISLSSFVVIDVLGMSVEHFGFFFGGPVLAFMAGSTIASRLAHRAPIERTIRIGVAIGVLGAAAILALAVLRVQTVAAVLVPVAVMGLAQGLVMPNSVAMALANHPTIAGSASALLGCVQTGIGALAGWVAGLLFDGSTLTLALFMAGGWAGTALTQVALLRFARGATLSG